MRDFNQVHPASRLGLKPLNRVGGGKILVEL